MDLDFVGPRPRIASNAYERYHDADKSALTVDLDFVGPRPRIASNAYERYGGEGREGEGGTKGEGARGEGEEEEGGDELVGIAAQQAARRKPENHKTLLKL